MLSQIENTFIVYPVDLQCIYLYVTGDVSNVVPPPLLRGNLDIYLF